MVPVAATPRPRVAQGGPPGNDDHAAPLSLRRVLDSESLVIASLERLDVEGLFVHEVVVALKAVVPGALLSFKRLIAVGRRLRGDQEAHRRNEDKTQAELAYRVLVHVRGL